jgi:hypothetical protein
MGRVLRVCSDAVGRVGPEDENGLLETFSRFYLFAGVVRRFVIRIVRNMVHSREKVLYGCFIIFM